MAKAAEIFCERWTALIIRDLAVGAERFADLQRGVPLMSPTLLSRRLKQLEAEGILERRRPTTGRGFTYHLTRAGREFVPLVEGLGVWGQRWSRRTLTEGEIDLGLLVWALERSVKGEALGPGRRVVEVEFTDQPADSSRASSAPSSTVSRGRRAAAGRPAAVTAGGPRRRCGPA